MGLFLAKLARHLSNVEVTFRFVSVLFKARILTGVIRLRFHAFVFLLAEADSCEETAPCVS